MITSGTETNGAPALPLGFAELASDYDLVLCDLWGVVHDGRQAFPAALDVLRQFREGGGTVVLLTNAPRPHASVLEQLLGLGVTLDAFDCLVTSGDATVAAIVERGDAPLFHIGPDRDRVLFDAVEQVSGHKPRYAEIAEAAYVVVTGIRDDIHDTPADYADELAAIRARNLTMICANPDILIHVGDQIRYCGGALAEAYENLGGETILAGKPHSPIYKAAFEEAARSRGQKIDRARVLAIGDGLRTDAAGAANERVDLLFITSGIHRDELHPDAEGELDRLAYAQRLAGVSHPLRAAMPHLVW